MANDLLSLAKILGAKNLTDNPFTKSPAGLDYFRRQQGTEEAQNLLQSAQTPIGALSAGIAYYLQNKRENKAFEDFKNELAAQKEAERVANQQKISTLASILPEDQRAIGSSLDLATLEKIASERLKPVSQEDLLNIENKRLQNQKLKKEISSKTMGAEAKPMPAILTKLQNEDLETIGKIGSLNDTLLDFENKIDEGKLELGPVRNLRSKAQNFVGMSDEISRNYSSFKSTLEKQRNDSLRLNSGVQTEGDAQRAWKELFENINDKNLVKQRLAEIRNINANGAQLKALNIERTRQEYGLPAIDFNQYQNTRSLAPAQPKPQQTSTSPQELARQELKRRGLLK